MSTLLGFTLILKSSIFCQTVEKILQDNMRHNESHLWLADTCENLPDLDGLRFIDGTKPPIDASWKSPFLGLSLTDVLEWFRGFPKPPKAVNKRYFAVVQK